MNTVFNDQVFWLRTILIITIGLLIANLPRVLNMLGLHRPYAGRHFELSGKRALIITTSQATMGETNKATGVYASEMTVAYYQFQDAKMQVDVASIKGGKIPIEGSSLRWPLLTPEDQRFLKDHEFQEKVKHSLKISEIDFTQYDIVFMAGGWGAAYDLGTSEILGQKISEAYAADVVLGSVCHGGLGFLRATDPNDQPLVQGRRITAVTDKQIKQLGISITPQHPERELRQAGALYERKSAILDIFASHVVVDGTLVTGQNQNDGAEVAQRMMEIVEKKNLLPVEHREQSF
jgi:putative intracellular protease/amidase